MREKEETKEKKKRKKRRKKEEKEKEENIITNCEQEGLKPKLLTSYGRQSSQLVSSSLGQWHPQLLSNWEDAEGAEGGGCTTSSEAGMLSAILSQLATCTQ